jgi:hypothetical protein
MSTSSIPPSTVDGIKRLAKTMGRERGITHTQALEVAAHEAGFQNFLHAKRAITKHAGLMRQSHSAFLTAHWYVLHGKSSPTTRRGGRETLEVALARPLPEVIARHQVPNVRNLNTFRMEYIDHLEGLPNSDSQKNARDRLLAAARSLRFLEATGLRPVTTQQQREPIYQLNDMPMGDHQSWWTDPATGEWLVLDEPYEHVVPRAAERERWLNERGFHIIAPAWEGLYSPGNSIPYFVY